MLKCASYMRLCSSLLHSPSAEIRKDTSSQYQSALLLGDVEERVKILKSAGQSKMHMHTPLPPAHTCTHAHTPPSCTCIYMCTFLLHTCTHPLMLYCLSKSRLRGLDLVNPMAIQILFHCLIASIPIEALIVYLMRFSSITPQVSPTLPYSVHSVLF